MKFQEMLKDSPKNWGRWGANDELGCLNFLTNQEVLRGVKAVRQGKTFTLGVPRPAAGVRSTFAKPADSDDGERQGRV
jgi:hypothetical protein